MKDATQQVMIQNKSYRDANVYANDRKNLVKFDVGLAPPNSTSWQQVTWKNGIVVRIGSKIRPKWRAWIASLSSKYYATVAFSRRGRKAFFRIANVPSNISKIKIWMPNYKVVTVSVKPGSSKTIDLKRRRRKRGTLKLSRR